MEGESRGGGDRRWRGTVFVAAGGANRRHDTCSRCTQSSWVVTSGSSSQRTLVVRLCHVHFACNHGCTDHLWSSS